MTPSLQPRDQRGRFARSPDQSTAPAPTPQPIGAMRVILKGNRDVLGQVEKQSAMEIVLSFLETLTFAEVCRGQHCWLVAMPPVRGEPEKLMQGILREGNIVGVARDPEQAREYGRKLAARYDPAKDGELGYGIVDAYAEKYYMFKDGWEIHDNTETVQEGH